MFRWLVTSLCLICGELSRCRLDGSGRLLLMAGFWDEMEPRPVFATWVTKRVSNGFLEHTFLLTFSTFPRLNRHIKQMMSKGCSITETKRIVLGFHETILSFGDWIPSTCRRARFIPGVSTNSYAWPSRTTGPAGSTKAVGRAKTSPGAAWAFERHLDGSEMPSSGAIWGKKQ